MAKRRRREAFATVEPAESFRPSFDSVAGGQSTGGMFGFLRDYGVRETIESILIAVVLALMFRAFQMEAFIIPTGSMAPSLQGQHMDVECRKCEYIYRTGATAESSTSQYSNLIEYTYCPICQYKMNLDRGNNPDHNSNNGDRILVNKFVYDFSDPKRWDVIVFKNPNNGKQNYIKRLVGLPGENLLVNSGDVFNVVTDAQGNRKLEILRKPPTKLKHMMQVVDDTNHIPRELRDDKVWASRWQQWRGAKAWQMAWDDDSPDFFLAPTPDTNWLRYRHLKPRPDDWKQIELGLRPDSFKQIYRGQLIGDYYCYNDAYSKRPIFRNGSVHREESSALHWVGDLGVECWLEVKSDQGVLKIDLVEGGAHFTCSIDVATGTATLESSDPTVKFLNDSGEEIAAPTAATKLRSAGSYQIQMTNVDDEVNLWINNKLIEFDGSMYSRDGMVLPKYSKADAGDAEPVGIGGENIDLSVTRLKVLRDIYYASTTNQNNIGNETGNRTLTNYTEQVDGSPRGMHQIKYIHRNVDKWESDQGKRILAAGRNKTTPMYELGANQFFPMGDNSPASLDARVWDGPKFVDGEMMIGRAMFIYWPHTKNKPIPYITPNFERMRFIR